MSIIWKLLKRRGFQEGTASWLDGRVCFTYWKTPKGKTIRIYNDFIGKLIALIPIIRGG